MFIELAAWLIFGCVAAWVAALMVRTTSEESVVSPVIAGAIGAVAATTVFRAFVMPTPADETTTTMSIIVAASMAATIAVLYRKQILLHGSWRLPKRVGRAAVTATARSTNHAQQPKGYHN